MKKKINLKQWRELKEGIDVIGYWDRFQDGSGPHIRDKGKVYGQEENHTDFFRYYRRLKTKSKPKPKTPKAIVIKREKLIHTCQLRFIVGKSEKVIRVRITEVAK